MGDDRKTTTQEQTTEQTFQPTAEQRELDRLALERAEATQTGLIGVQQQGLSLVNQLLTGQQLPGQLQGLFGGISPEVTSELAQESIQDLLPAFQKSGILDSGVAVSIAARTAGDIRRTSAESNLNRRLQLLNLAVGGQAQVQQPILGAQQVAGARQVPLAGRTGFATGTTTQTQMNPFLRSFQTSLGSGLGGALGAGAGGFIF